MWSLFKKRPLRPVAAHRFTFAQPTYIWYCRQELVSIAANISLANDPVSVKFNHITREAEFTSHRGTLIASVRITGCTSSETGARVTHYVPLTEWIQSAFEDGLKNRKRPLVVTFVGSDEQLLAA